MPDPTQARRSIDEVFPPYRIPVSNRERALWRGIFVAALCASVYVTVRLIGAVAQALALLP